MTSLSDPVVAELIEKLRAIARYANFPTTIDTLNEAADQLTVLSQRIGVLEAEHDDLMVSVIAFAGPWATEWSRDRLPKGHLHPTHYDLLERCGARMDDFTRAALPPPPATNGETK